MKEFTTFTPELLDDAKIREALRVVFMQRFSAVSYPFSNMERNQASTWFYKSCATLLDADIKTEKIIEATKTENLTKLFDELEIKTWTIGKKSNQYPILNATKADIVKQFFLALEYHNYNIVPVLERYLKSI